MKSDARSLRLLPSPMPDAIDLDAAISELEDSASIYHGVGKSYRQRFKGKAPVVADRISAHHFREIGPRSQASWNGTIGARPAIASIVRRFRLDLGAGRSPRLTRFVARTTTMAHNLIKAKISALACLPTKVRSIRLR